MAVTTPGRYLIQQALPEKFRDFQGALDGKQVKKLFTQMAKELPSEEYRQRLKRLNNIGNVIATEYGGVASIHLSDLKIPANLQAMRKELDRKIYAIQQSRRISSEDKKKQIIALVREATPAIDKEVLATLGSQENSFGLQVATGVRGKPQQLRQLVFGDLLSLDSKMREIPVPTLRSYGEGITPLQYWVASHGGRQGYIGVQKATADAGYFAKQVRSAAHRQIITTEDCGKAKPYAVKADDDNNIGSLLYADTKGKSGKVYPKNTPITSKMLDDLPDTVYVRSAITCGAREGVCSLCSGIRETNKLPTIGESVGMNAVNSFLEGLTQSGLSSKHGGGEAVGARRIKHGLDAVDQFINMPEEFVGGATIAEVDGIVQGIKEAPQGGVYVFIADKAHHVPADATVSVKKGDQIEAGDLLCDGMPNMRKIVQHKGIGEGRRLFVNALSDVLDSASSGVIRKNIETFARAYVNKVRITDPDGVQGWLIDDLADYNALASKWQPREGAYKAKTSASIGKYLELPTLHYSIGTRVTKRVADTLMKEGITEIDVHNDPAPFEPAMVSAKQFATVDDDFLTALSGENLMRSIEAHTQHGADTEKDSTSYYPRITFMSGGGADPIRVS